jgi:hypothetical protein
MPQIEPPQTVLDRTKFPTFSKLPERSLQEKDIIKEHLRPGRFQGYPGRFDQILA